MTSLSFESAPDGAMPIDMLEHYFRSHDWNFEREGDEEIVTSVKGSWSDYELRGLWRSDDQVLQFIAMTGISIGQAAGRDELMRLYELLGLVNEQLWIGHFELWSSDGAILFRHAMLLDGAEEGLSLLQAHVMVDAAIEECERYYPAFQFVLWGGKTPREALQAAMTETEGEA